VDGAYTDSVLKLPANRLTVFIIRLPVLYIQKYQLNTSLLMSLPFNTGSYTVSFTCVSFKPRTVLYILSHYTVSLSINSIPPSCLFLSEQDVILSPCVSFKPRTVLYCLIILYLYLSTLYLPRVSSVQNRTLYCLLHVSLLNLGRYCPVSLYCISIYQLNTSLMSLPFSTGSYTVSFTCVSFKPMTVLFCLIMLYLYLSTQYLPHVSSLQHRTLYCLLCRCLF
jgi:hypothetical protein